MRTDSPFALCHDIYQALKFGRNKDSIGFSSKSREILEKSSDKIWDHYFTEEQIQDAIDQHRQEYGRQKPNSANEHAYKLKAINAQALLYEWQDELSVDAARFHQFFDRFIRTLGRTSYKSSRAYKYKFEGEHKLSEELQEHEKLLEEQPRWIVKLYHKIQAAHKSRKIRLGMDQKDKAERIRFYDQRINRMAVDIFENFQKTKSKRNLAIRYLRSEVKSLLKARGESIPKRIEAFEPFIMLSVREQAEYLKRSMAKLRLAYSKMSSDAKQRTKLDGSHERVKIRAMREFIELEHFLGNFIGHYALWENIDLQDPIYLVDKLYDIDHNQTEINGYARQELNSIANAENMQDLTKACKALSYKFDLRDWKTVEGSVFYV